MQLLHCGCLQLKARLQVQFDAIQCWPFICLFLQPWVMAAPELLDCKVAAFLFADWAVKRNLLVDSITWEANWELADFPLRLQVLVQSKVFIDSHCHQDRRLRSLTSRAPADQKKWTCRDSGWKWWIQVPERCEYPNTRQSCSPIFH